MIEIKLNWYSLTFIDGFGRHQDFFSTKNNYISKNDIRIVQAEICKEPENSAMLSCSFLGKATKSEFCND